MAKLRKWIIRAGAGIGFLLVLFTVYATIPFLFLTESNSCPPTEPEKMNRFIDLELPASTRNLWSDCKNFKGFTVQTRFEIEPSDLDMLLQSTNINQPLSSTDRPEILGFLDEAVREETRHIEMYLYGDFFGNDWHEEILIDTGESNDYIVYYVVGDG